MSERIDKITAVISTAGNDDSSTTAPVYLGIGGREFRLESREGGDFAPGVERRFDLGEESDVVSPERNHPGDPQLYVDRLDRFPVYLRLAAGKAQDDWQLERADVVVHSPVHTYTYTALAGADKLWLGLDCGLVAHLTQ